MSNIVTTFNPATTQTDTFTAAQSAANGVLVFWNESNIGLTISFQDGSNFYLPAWYNKHSCGYSGSVNITWAVKSTLAATSPPLSEVIVESYASGEHYPADGPLVRQTNLGNTVTTSQGSTLSIVNDGNAAATSIIEATVLADSSSAVSLTNNAVLILGTVANPGSTTIKGPVTLNGTFVLNNVATITGQLTMSGADIQLDNNRHIICKDNGGTPHNTLFINTSNSVVLEAATQFIELHDRSNNPLYVWDMDNGLLIQNGTNFTIQGPAPNNQIILTTSNANTYIDGSNSSVMRANGSNIAVANTNGFNLQQRLNFGGGVGGVAAINTFTGTNTTTLVAHGIKVLGVDTAPDFIAVTGTSGTAAFEYSAVTTTTCTITCSVNVSWKAVAFKF